MLEDADHLLPGSPKARNSPIKISLLAKIIAHVFLIEVAEVDLLLDQMPYDRGDPAGFPIRRQE
jgi:hypothetical protein